MTKLLKGKKVGWMNVLNCLALVLVAGTANAACSWIFGQPEEPEEVKSMRKF